MVNLIALTSELPRKLEVLGKHCARFDRDPDSINKTVLLSLFFAPTMEEAEVKRNAFLARRGLDWDALDDTTRTSVSGRLMVGDADAVGEQLSDLLDIGLDGVCVNLPYDAHDLDNLAAAGEALSKANPRP